MPHPHPLRSIPSLEQHVAVSSAVLKGRAMQRFSHGQDTGSPPQRQSSSRLTRKTYTALLALAAAVLILGISFSFGRTPTARAATWTQIWGDEFNGAANTGVNTSN